MPTKPSSMGNWVLCLPGLRQWLQWLGVVKRNSMSLIRDVLDELTMGPDINIDTHKSIVYMWNCSFCVYTQRSEHLFSTHTHATSTEKQINWLRYKGRYIAHMDTEGHIQAGTDTGKAKTYYITTHPWSFYVNKVLVPPAVLSHQLTRCFMSEK